MIGPMQTTSRLHSCDDHLDLWNLPRDVWEDRLPARLRERGYPHPDSTFPHSREAVAHAFRGLVSDFVERVTATNCKRLYGFV